MKVLWFTNTPCGATEKLTGAPVTVGGWLYALSEEIVKHKEVDLHIAFYWGKQEEPFYYKGITYHPVLRNGYGSKIGRYLYRLKQQFDKFIDDNEIDRLFEVYSTIKPDIVHFHGSEENFGLLAEKIDIPMVLSIQGMLSPIFYKYYSGFQRSKVFRTESYLAKLMLDGYGANERRMMLRLARERRILKAIPNIIGRTYWDRDCSLFFNPSRRYFICNEILRSEFMTSEWKRPNSDVPFVLSTTISNGIYKGLEMVFTTAKLLLETKVPFKWIVIGIDKQDALSRMTQKITGIYHSDVNVELIGRKNAHEMVDVLKNCHAFIQVSHIENSPNSLCEAMALGIPIIASNAGGTASMLQDGKEGILVQDGDPYRLAGAIMNMMHDYSNAEEMGKAACNKALKRHTSTNVLEELWRAYYEILKS